jgi:hypothetical protein
MDHREKKKRRPGNGKKGLPLSFFQSHVEIKCGQLTVSSKTGKAIQDNESCRRDGYSIYWDFFFQGFIAEIKTAKIIVTAWKVPHQ